MVRQYAEVAFAIVAGPAHDELRHVTPSEIPLAALTLAEAFVDDPLMMHLNGGRPVPIARGLPLFTAFLRIQVDRGIVIATPGFEGVAVWSPPDRWKVPLTAILRNLPTFVMLYGRRLPRNLRVLDDLERKHPEAPHYYLEFIGTSPIHRGRGFGTPLIERIVARADEEGVGMYLENSSTDNMAFYGRFGFETREVIHHRHDGPPHWLMWRDPK
jgi:GNAT superfamily N-acetyltransferase